MADNALLTGCLLLCLVPVMARLSPVDLLGPPRRTQILMGVMGGVASALVIVMLGWKVPELDIAVYPTITAFIGLYFGAPAALICAALALVPLLWTSDAGWFAGCVALGVAIVLSAIWRSMDTRRVANPWFNMLGLAVTVPLGIELCFLATGLIEPATGSRRAGYPDRHRSQQYPRFTDSWSICCSLQPSCATAQRLKLICATKNYSAIGKY